MGVTVAPRSDEKPNFHIARSLVVEYDVGQPDFLRRDIENVDVAVLLGVPFELVIVPFLHRIATQSRRRQQTVTF